MGQTPQQHQKVAAAYLSADGMPPISAPALSGENLLPV
jgi:hypothetical protein